MVDKEETTWIEISRSAIENNHFFFKSLLQDGVKFAAVVKANAYGHGIGKVAKVIDGLGVDVLAVNSIEEALSLREMGIETEVLIMGAVPGRNLGEVVRHGFRAVLYNIETLDELNAVSERLDRPSYVHLKLETGTYRQGIEEAKLGDFLEKLSGNRAVIVEGAYTHFANIEDTTNHEYAMTQLEKFKKMVRHLRERGLAIPLLHTTCTAAALLFKETHFDMVRTGIGLYGLWPSRETYICYVLDSGNQKGGKLKSVLTWKTRICQVKDVPRGSFIGYGCTYRTTSDSKIAVLPVGYYDGYDRRLSNSAHVLIRGKRAPVRGRICMNLMMVDVTHIEGARTGDEVVLIGKDGEEEVTADDLAQKIGTINYEVVTRIREGIPRLLK